MLSRKLLPALGFLLAMTASPAVNAGDLVLDSFVDQSPATVNLPATQLQMATVNTTAVKGGTAAVDTTVSIGGSVAPADVVEVCVDYGGGTPSCQAISGSLTNVTIAAPAGATGGSPFNYSITLNSSAGGETIQLTVVNITVPGGKNSVLVDNLPLPRSTATRPIVGSNTAPTVSSPTFASVTFNSAILGGTMTNAGTPATVTDCGVEWGTATGSYAGGSASFGVCTLNTPFTVGVGGLPSSDTIYFRAWADNSLVGVSSEATFVTKPSVTTTAATGIAPTQAVLGGNVAAGGGAAVTGRGVYWHTAPGATAGTKVAMGSGSGAFSSTVGSLSPATTYYFVAYATNSSGETVAANELPFTTAAVSPPTVATRAVANITATTAELGGNVTSDGGAAVTDRGIVWNTTSPPETGGTVVPMGIGTGEFFATVSDLPTGTLVYFKAYATNTQGTAYSTVQSFTPSGPPSVNATPASGIGQNSATLGGQVTSNGGGTITATGIVYDLDSDPVTGGTEVPVTVPAPETAPFSTVVGGLLPGTNYWFKAYAQNAAGRVYSSDPAEAFTTLAGPPILNATPTVANIQATSADLGGTISADGGAAVTERGIVWNTTSPPETGGTVVPMGSGIGTFSQNVSGLPTGQLVYFRAYAINAQGTVYSDIASFTPVGEPTVTSSYTNVTHNSAVLGGNVTGNGGSAIIERGIYWNTASPATAGTKVAMGSGLGIFSQTVSLPSGQTIYLVAYATNATTTGYSSPEVSFPTGTEPTVQASNITFPGVYGKSLRISWTRGNGDGSIVVMRLDSDASTDPVDGTDYTANPDYTLAAPINAQNLVVYKGSSSTVWVTGLEMSTTYSVTVYDYAGSGASTDYLQTTPAQASQATTSVAAHNYDNRVMCTDCHDHGAWIPRGTVQKSACETCHNPSGQASAKLEFDNHLSPGKNPSIDVVDCGMCHELHALGGANTTESLNSVTLQTQHNKSFLRANVDKYVSTAATPAYLHTDQPLREDPHPDAPLLADNPDRAVEGGNDTTARGYCQVCHTLTNYHRSSNTAGADQCHDGETGNCGPVETNCGTCHQHNNQFQGVGGTASCVTCHDSIQAPRPIITTQFDRLTTHIPGGSATVTEEDCRVCHDQATHKTGTVRGYDADTGTTSFAQPTAYASTTATGEGEVYAPHCLSCHDDGSADSLPASGSDQTATSPFTGSGAPPVIEGTAWAGAAHNRPSASFSPAMTCVGDGANGCHGSGHGSENTALLAPVGGPATAMADFCLGCHDGTPAVDVTADFAGAAITATSASGALVNNRHDVSTADQSYSSAQVACSDCHNPHADAAGAGVSDLITGGALRNYSPSNSYVADGHDFAYDSGGNLDPVNPVGSAGGFSEPDTIQFCLVCHDGTTPNPGVVMTAGMVNMATAWNGTDQHGSGDGSTGSRTGKGGLKFPWVSTADDAADNDPPNTYAAMNCTTCHGAHGTGNIFNLRESITVGGVVMTVGGATGFLSDPAYAGNSTYTLPLIGGAQTDHYWGAWCSFCHKGDAHPGKVEADQCTGGHMHGGGAF